MEKVIDVDKLDYLIRDAYITGFDTVSIDYERLLGALTIVKTDSGPVAHLQRIFRLKQLQ